MAKTITYGVRGLLEFHAMIKIGNSTLHIPFTGGTLSAYGINPAAYSTDNKFYQYAIEHSNYYRNGKIFKVSEYGKDDEPAPVAEGGEQSPAETTEDGTKVVKVSGYDEAREYLMDNYGYTVSRVRSKKNIDEAATANKIKFVYEEEEEV